MSPCVFLKCHFPFSCFKLLILVSWSSVWSLLFQNIFNLITVLSVHISYILLWAVSGPYLCHLVNESLRHVILQWTNIKFLIMVITMIIFTMHMAHTVPYPYYPLNPHSNLRISFVLIPLYRYWDWGLVRLSVLAQINH